MKAFKQRSSQRALLALQLIWTAGLLISGRAPYERLTWLMEVMPCLILMPILWRTRGRFVFTPMVYGLMTVHGLILMLGGAYSYARVPLGFWMQDWFDFARNNYDKIGHFAQGFVPAFVTRELLMRVYTIKHQRLIAGLCVSVSLAISALYELVEWWSALLLGSGADEFLGTQGYVWDTQSDMFMALIGALCALLFVRWHINAMHKLS
jgi:putative membrane protein